MIENDVMVVATNSGYGDVLSLVLWIPFILFAVIGIICGLVRGKDRALIRIAGIAIAGVVAVVLAKIIAGSMSESFMQTLVDSGIFEDANMGELGDVLLNTPEIKNFIDAIPAALGAVVIYIGLLPVLNLLGWIVNGFVCSKKEHKGKPLGMLYGLLGGVLMCAFFMAPIVGMIPTAGDALDELSVVMEDTISTEDVAALTEHPVTKVMNACGAETLTNFLMTTKVEGKKISLLDEVKDLIPVISPILDVATEEEINTEDLGEILEQAQDNEILTAAIDGVAKNMIADTIAEATEGKEEVISEIVEAVKDMSKEEIVDYAAKALEESGIADSEGVRNYINGFIDRQLGGEVTEESIQNFLNSLNTEGTEG